MRRLIVGGEDLKVALAQSIAESFGGAIEIINEYGPTEAVVGCMSHTYDPGKNTGLSVPIGVPAANVQCYVLDKHLNPLPVNTIGELYIASDGLARGYLGKLELTQEKFIANPLAPGKKMYKTGDLARFINDTTLEYSGRADQQVNIRGYRVELGEIESHLLRHKAVRNAAVIDYEDKHGSKGLCAYIVKNYDVSPKELREHLLRYIPYYMVPVYFVELDEIPLTIHGKLDKALLLQTNIETTADTEFVPYRDEREKKLVQVISDVLHIRMVSIKHNFYHLGGDLIKAIQIASRLSEMGLKIKLKDILSYPIIAEMALCLEESLGPVMN